MAVQLFWPDCKIRRELTKLACKGLCFGGVLWVYMAYLSKNLDYGIATAQFITNGIASVSLGAVLAYGLNSDQIYYEKNERAV